MIGYLCGILKDKTPDTLILDVGGVGYEVTVPASSFCALPKVSEIASLYIHTHVREDSLRLFGFASLFDRKVFELLINVSSVGPKLALSLLGPLRGIELCQAITANKISMLVSIPGVGQKTAERLILELRTKFQSLLMRQNEYYGANASVENASDTAFSLNSTPSNMDTNIKYKVSILEDLEAALLNLGYKEKQVCDFVKTYEIRIRNKEEITLESALRESLRTLSGHLISK